MTILTVQTTPNRRTLQASVSTWNELLDTHGDLIPWAISNVIRASIAKTYTESMRITLARDEAEAIIDVAQGG